MDLNHFDNHPNFAYLISCLTILSRILVVTSSQIQTISENDEVHFEVWKERHVNYIDRNSEVSDSEGDGMSHFYETEATRGKKAISTVSAAPLNIDSIPKAMIDLFYKNANNKNFLGPKTGLIVRSFRCENIQYENSDARIIMDFNLNTIHNNAEKIQEAQLTLKSTPTNSSKRYQNVQKVSAAEVYLNGVFAQIKYSLTQMEITLNATVPVENWIQNPKNVHPNPLPLKFYLEFQRGFALESFNFETAILLVHSIVDRPDLENEADLSELIHHEETILLRRQTQREKRSNHLSNDIPVAPPAPSNPIIEDYEELEEFTNDVNRHVIISNRLGVHGKQLNPHVRRHLAKKMWGPCRKRPFYVNFSEVKFDSWIIAPKGYQAFECYGRCGYPLGAHLTPTKHAIMRAMLNGISPKKATRACCVPTKLEPISLLYMDDNGVVTYKYNYDDMIVADCGCR